MANERIEDRYVGCVVGSMIGDALAMPVHWYYDTESLADLVNRTFPTLEKIKNAEIPESMIRGFGYFKPTNPHPTSILFRSSYSGSIDILHDQKRYWGPSGRGVHYHQFLNSGENTLNLQLCRILLASLVEQNGQYHPVDYLNRYVDYLTVPKRHRETYVEECHRNFFSRLAKQDPSARDFTKCGGRDIHIGGLAHVGLMSAWAHARGLSCADAVQKVLEHMAHTHRDADLFHAATNMVSLLYKMFDSPLEATATPSDLLRTAIASIGPEAAEIIQASKAANDYHIIGRMYSPACYIDSAFPATLTLAYKYSHDPEAGLVANVLVGGDNCHRGAVLGAIFGAAHGLSNLPSRWVSTLSESQNLCSSLRQLVRLCRL